MGEYIIFVDSDDALRQYALDLLYNTLLDNNVDVVVGDFESNSGGEMRQLHSNRKIGLLNKTEYTKYTALLQLSMSTQARLYKRSLFDSAKLDIDRRIIQNEDFLWNFIISNNVHSAFVIDTVVYSVYTREGSASRTLSEFKYWRFFFSYIENNLDVFCIEENNYFNFKITRIADLMRNYYYINFKDSIFDNIRNHKFEKQLSLWGNFVILFARCPILGNLQGILKFHPSTLFKKLS